MYVVTFNSDEEISAVAKQMNAPPQGGFDLKSMRTALALIEALERVKPGEPFEIEDKHYAYFQQRMTAARWNVARREIEDLVERCVDAPKKAEQPS